MCDENPKRLKMEESNRDDIANNYQNSVSQCKPELIEAQNNTDSTENKVSQPENLKKSSNRQKHTQEIPEPSTDEPHCQFWVKPKNRYCKMTLKAGAKFCGEHAVVEPDLNGKRVLCPLDPSHSVYAFRLKKHLEICNVKKLEVRGSYVKKDINVGGSMTSSENEDDFRLCDVPRNEIERIIKIVEDLFAEFVDGKIENSIKSHKALEEEMKKDFYGDDKMRHLVQTSSILGILNDNGLFGPQTCFIDLGAGKGKLSYWIAKAIIDEKIDKSKVLVVDRASHRHKRDNSIRELGIVERLRVDIGDLDMKELNFFPSQWIVGVSKHLCGRATDFALRCLLNGNKGTVKTKGFLICVCCHHQITYDSFIGQDWMAKHGIDRRTFNTITKMASWCTCGDGRSREEHKETRNVVDEKVKEREIVGWKCKRLLDYSRIEYMREQGYETSLCYYVEKEQTLENICIFGKLK